MSNFNNLHLSKECVSAILQLGFTAPTEIQTKAIPLIVQGRDLVGLSQTGTGKTVAYVAPLIDKINLECKFGVQVLVLVPTRELAEQVLGEVKKLIKYKPDVKPVAIFGGQEISRQIIALKKGANFVVGTPGRIMDHLGRKTIKLQSLKTAVLDEADEMLNMGFRADMEKILGQTPSERQTLMFSATMSNDIMALVKNFLRDPVTLKIGETNRTIASIRQVYYMVGKNEKKQALSDLLKNLEAGTTIVFCNTKRMVDAVEGYLKKMGFSATGLHGDMKQNIRRKVMQGFKCKDSQILVTTDISARGIDVKDVLHVINFDIPQNQEYYIHRVGRTGRAGKGGNAYTLLNNPEQVKELREIEKRTNSKIILERMELSKEFNVPVANTNAKRPQKLNNNKRDTRGPKPTRENPYEKQRFADPKRKQRQTHKSTARGEAGKRRSGGFNRSDPYNNNDRPRGDELITGKRK
ncbi:MAG: DEAD/DEAH box helicase [Firmicutes bacterium]|nr:DEAD/DEAH box helicase [Bacillota bacterium]